MDWQQRGFATKAEFDAALASAEAAWLDGTITPDRYSQLVRFGKASDFAAIGPAGGSTPSKSVPVATRPVADYLQNEQVEYVTGNTASREAENPATPLSEEEKQSIREAARTLATTPRNQGGDRPSAVWATIESYLPDVFKTQVISENINDDPTTLEWAVTNHQGGKTVEGWIPYLGRILNIPVATVVGAVDPYTTAKERMMRSEGVADLVYDAAKHVISRDMSPAARKPLLDFNTQDRAALGLAWLGGLAMDIALPIDLGVSDAVKGARAYRIGQQVMGELGVPTSVLEKPTTALAVERVATRIKDEELDALSSWVKAAREGKAPTKTLTGLPSDAAQAQAALRLARTFDQGDDVANAAVLAASMRVGESLRKVDPKATTTRVGNIVVTGKEGEVLPAVQEALKRYTWNDPAKLAQELQDTGVMDRLGGTGMHWLGPQAGTKPAKLDLSRPLPPELLTAAAEQAALRLPSVRGRYIDLAAVEDMAQLQPQVLKALKSTPKTAKSLPPVIEKWLTDAGYRIGAAGEMVSKEVAKRGLVPVLFETFQHPASRVRWILEANPDWAANATIRAVAEQLAALPGSRLNKLLTVDAAKAIAALEGRTFLDLIDHSNPAELRIWESVKARPTDVAGRMANPELVKRPAAVLARLLVHQVQDMIAKQAVSDLASKLKANWTNGAVAPIVQQVSGEMAAIRKAGVGINRIDDATLGAAIVARHLAVALGTDLRQVPEWQALAKFLKPEETRAVATALAPKGVDAAFASAEDVRATLRAGWKALREVTSNPHPLTQSLAIAWSKEYPNLDSDALGIMLERVTKLVEDSRLSRDAITKIPMNLLGTPSLSDEVAGILAKAPEKDIVAVAYALYTTGKDNWLTRIVGGAVSGVVQRPVDMALGMARSGMLGGWLVPNFTYHAVNVLTAPMIMWQTLGGNRAAKGSLMAASMVLSDLQDTLQGITRADRVVLKTPGKDWTTVQILEEATKRGALGGQNTAELTQSVLEDVIRWSDLTTGGKAVGGVQNWLRRNLDPTTMGYCAQIGQYFDSRFRLGAFMDSLARGETLDQAADVARAALFNYNDLSDLERKTAGRLLWFYRFTRQNVVTAVKGLVQNPARMRNILRVANTGKGEAQDLGLTPGDAQDHKYVLPEWAETRPLVWGLLKKSDTDQYFAVTGPPIPAADAFATLGSLLAVARRLGDPTLSTSEEITATAQRAGTRVLADAGPFVSAGAGLVFGARPDKSGEVRREGARIDPDYVALAQAMGAWDALQWAVPMTSAKPQQAASRAGQNMTTDTGNVWLVENTEQAKRNWGLIQDVAMMFGQERAINDLYGPAAYYMSSNANLVGGIDMTTGNTYLDTLWRLGIIRPMVVTSTEQMELDRKRDAAFELKDETPQPYRGP